MNLKKRSTVLLLSKLIINLLMYIFSQGEKNFFMKRKKQKSLEKLDIKFCTECNEILNEFDISEAANDLNAVKENHDNCKRTGKFKGELCARIFISNPDDSTWQSED